MIDLKHSTGLRATGCMKKIQIQHLDKVLQVIASEKQDYTSVVLGHRK